MARHVSRVKIKDWRRKLHAGLIPAVPATLGKSGELHRAAHDAYVQYMTRQPIAGVAVWAHTGRGLLLDAETRAEVLRSWRSGLPRYQCVIAGAGANAARERDPERYCLAALGMAEEALRLGADALLVYPPTLFRDLPNRDTRIVDYHRRFAELDVPLVLFYLYEAAGGVGYSPEVLDALLRLPQVIGIKMATLDSVMTYQDVARRIRRTQPDKLLITGEDRFLGYSLMCGGDAALIGMGAACCRLQADLLQAHAAGESERFLELSRRTDILAAHTFIAPMEGYIRRMLWVLVLQGVIPVEAAYDPWGPDLPKSEYRALEVALREIGEAAGASREKGA